MPKLELEEQLSLYLPSFLVIVSVLVLTVSSFYDTHACRNDDWFSFGKYKGLQEAAVRREVRRERERGR